MVKVMPWCPKCKYEYEEGIEKCSECKIKLVEELEKETHEEENNELSAIPKEFDEPAFLISASDHIEAKIIESKLRPYNIPVWKKHKETGAFLQIYMGDPPFGIDIFVPSKLLKEAQNIIKNEPDEE